MKVAIIGAGAVGLSAARFASRAGNEVTVFEQFDLFHGRGSSHGTSRIIRKAYPDAYFVRIMQECYPLWRELEADSGKKLFTESGFLIIGNPHHNWYRNTKQTLQDLHIAHWEMGPVDAMKRFGGIHLDPDEAAILQPEAGWLAADEVLEANANLASKHGATIHERCRAHASPNGTVNGEKFDAVVLTQGAWIRQHVALPVSIRLQRFGYYNASIGEGLPAWVEASDDMFYGFPDYGRGFKLGQHHYGPEIDPDAVELPQDDGAAARLDDAARRRLGSMSRRGELDTCLYTVAPGEDFLIGALPWEIPAYFVSACSGHGFKFSIWFGWLLAEMIEGRKRPEEYERFYVTIDA